MYVSFVLVWKEKSEGKQVARASGGKANKHKGKDYIRDTRETKNLEEVEL